MKLIRVISILRRFIRKISKSLPWIRPLKKLLPKLWQLHQYAPRPMRLSKQHYAPSVLQEPYPTISIVTPSFNQGRFIEETIQSVLQQNYPALEYIVQDGASKDNTKEILEKFRSQFAHVASEKDSGQANAINMGFSHSTGEIMAWLNSDDIILPNTLHHVAHFFQQNPEVDVIYGYRLLIDENSQEIGCWILPPHNSNVLKVADFIPQETLFWRRRIWEKVGSYVDESFQFALDWDLLLRFMQAGAKFKRLPRLMGGFRVHPQQKTTKEMNSIGLQEIERLRLRTHGEKVPEEKISCEIYQYYIQTLWYDRIFKLKRIF